MQAEQGHDPWGGHNVGAEDGQRGVEEVRMAEGARREEVGAQEGSSGQARERPKLALSRRRERLEGLGGIICGRESEQRGDGEC